MPSLDPLAPDVMKLFRREKYQKCSKTEPLTRIVKNYDSNLVILHLDEKIRQSQYSSIFGGSVKSCCYEEIKRTGEGNDVDNKYK